MSRFRSTRRKNNELFFSTWEYKRLYWKEFDYKVLHEHIMTRKKRGRSDSIPWNDIIIMGDTETSKRADAYEEQIIMPEYEALRPWLLSGSGIRIMPDIQKDITDYKAWKKENKKYIKISDKGLDISIAYMELSQMFPYLFPDDVYHPADQVQLLVDTLKDYEPDPEAGKPKENHVCLWTISLRAFHTNIVTLYGVKPSEMVECIDKIHETLPGQRTLIFFHNWSYDQVFLRKFMFAKWGYPKKQLSTKPHYPIWTSFDNEINIRDSLILAQRSLELWSIDMEVEHAKAVGFWDYDKIRNQDLEQYTEEELHYAEFDTLAGVECIDKLMENIGKDITSLPFTSTGIIRNKIREIGKINRAHDWFLRTCVDDFDFYQKQLRIYHGGFVHANRYIINELIEGNIVAYDFASSYPFCVCAFTYPAEKFMQLVGEYTVKDVFGYYKNNYACMFTVELEDIHLKDPRFPMPVIQQSKLVRATNPILDNGRVLDADYICMELTEIDLILIDRYYTYKNDRITDLWVAEKDYLPRWFTDIVFDFYTQKCKLKYGSDKVAYDISKTYVNGLYGLTVQKPVPDDILEDYSTGEYYTESITREEAEKKYQKFLNSKNTMLNYSIGMYVTCYAMYNLFMLGECAGRWYYSDTDSCYGEDWNMDKVKEYNKQALQKLRDNGYDQIDIQGHTFTLGAAELDGQYKEFKTTGSKRYVCRKMDDSIKLTVAGVPKQKGAACLRDLNDFKVGKVFSGSITGKKQHTYIYVDDIYIDEYGNEVGDSIDLSPTDYTLDSTENWTWLFDELLGTTFSMEVDCFDEGRII